MANNRLYIKCKSCGEELCIGKHFGHCYFTPSDDTDKRLNNFYEKHAFCQKDQDGFADRGYFEITYEIEPSAELPKGDLISRADVLKYPIRLDHYDEENGSREFVYGVESVIEYVESLPSADAVDCTDFIEWLVDRVLDETIWEYNSVAYGEIICRKLEKLGILEVTEKPSYYIRPSADAEESYLNAFYDGFNTATEALSADAVPQLKQADTLIIADALRYLAQDTERHLSDRTRADALREQILKYGASMCHSADAEQEAVPTVVRVTMSDGSQYYLEHEHDAIQADAVQGEWIRHELFGNPWFTCSECNYHGRNDFNFCPNCGARMKGGAE